MVGWARYARSQGWHGDSLVALAERLSKTERSLLWLAGLSLALGVLVYALDRSGTTYFLPSWLSRDAGPAVFGQLGRHLPTFVHPFAFVLITVAVLRPPPRLLPAICMTWFAIEFAFELGQLASFGEHIAAAVPEWFEDTPLLGATSNYFSRGTFDPLDVLAIGLGVVGAYCVVRQSKKEEITHENIK